MQSSGLVACCFLAIQLVVGVSEGEAQFTALNLNTPEMAGSSIYAVSAGSFGGYARVDSPSTYHAPVLWSGPASWASLHLPEPTPGGGNIFGIAAEQQVGQWHSMAAMWCGTAASYVNLTPSGATTSTAQATTGSYQAGYAWFGTDTYPKAGTWHGTAQSWTILNPVGATGSYAWAVAGDRQGGQVVLPGPPGGLFHAALWSGTAESFLDITPGPGFGSCVFGMSGDQQVGWVSSATMASHASIWNGTAASWRDLNPPGHGMSVLYATCGTAQVGYASSASGAHAGIWFGAADRFIDLGQFLPPGYGDSVAYAVEERDGVFTVGGEVYHNGRYEAFVWIGVPSPTTMGATTVYGLLVMRRKRSTS